MRVYLLDMEYLARTQPVENSVQPVDGGLGEAPADQVRASIAAMTWQAFERHVAELLRRDGCTDVVVRQARSDRGIDITARAVDRFDIALYVATCNFSHEAQAIADLSGVITVDRDDLEAWSAGVRLTALR
ncbi:restriction endonuclease [Streptomyces glaucescens]